MSAKIIFFLTLPLFALSLSCRMELNEGATTPDELVNQFVESLENNDEVRLRSLVAPGYKASEEISNWLELYGGSEVLNFETEYTQTENANFLHIDLKINSVNNGVIFDDRLNSTKEENSWFLVIGKPPN